MSIDYKVKSAIKRAMRTGELLYLDYDNKVGKNTFYFLGLNYIKFNKDESVLEGVAFNYQYDGTKRIKIRMDRIKSARCVEGTKNNFETKLKQLLTVPEISNYFADNLKEGHILDYYVECIENSDDFEYQSTYHLKSTSLEKLKSEGVHDLHKSEVNNLLKLLNVSPKSKKEKHKIAFNKLSITNRQKEVVPIVYYTTYLDVINKQLLITRDEETYAIKNVARILRIPIEEAEQYRDKYDVLYEEIEKNIEKDLIEENPVLYQFKVDINLSPRGSYKKIKDIIYSKDELCAPLRAFFGKYNNPAINNNKNVYFIDNKVNDKQVLATTSAINNDITYIQGPPGTGKTTTILNMIASSMLNNESCLVTSFTNKAVDNIFLKMQDLKFNGYRIPIPMLRIGSEDHKRAGVKYLRDTLKFYYDSIRGKIDLVQLQKEYSKEVKEEYSKFTSIKRVLEDVSKKQVFSDNITYYERLIKMTSNNDRYKKTIEKSKKNLANQRRQLSKIKNRSLESVVEGLDINPNVTLKGLMIMSIELCEKILKNKEIASFISLPNMDDKIKGFYDYYRKQPLEDVMKMFPVIFSTTISTRSIGDTVPVIDLLIMDEAGQCENAHAIVALSKCKRAVLVGDPSQLLPVVTLNDSINEKLVYEYNIPDVFNYKKTSVLNTMNQVDFGNEIILLDHHYRCKKSIIDFSNKKYYNGMLKVHNQEVSDDDCVFVDVKSEFHNDIRNTSYNEVRVIEGILNKTKYNSIGVISPFKNQAKLILGEINDFGKDISVGTVHKFQGQERELIILSLAIGKDSYKGTYDWIKNNKELLNVATTRPKNQLMVLGDKESIYKLHDGEASDIIDLIEYTDSYTSKDFKDFVLGKVYNSTTNKSLYTPSEKLFLDTLENIIEVYHGGLKINGQTDMKQALGIHIGHELFESIKMSSFDFVLIDSDSRIRLAIEVCGPEHSYDQKTIARDKKKRIAATEKGITIIPISNRDVRKFEKIREIISEVMY